MKGIKAFLKRKKEKMQNIVENNTNIYQKMKNKSLLKIEKKYYKMKKILILITRNYYVKK